MQYGLMTRSFLSDALFNGGFNCRPSYSGQKAPSLKMLLLFCFFVVVFRRQPQSVLIFFIFRIIFIFRSTQYGLMTRSLLSDALFNGGFDCWPSSV